MKKSSGHKSNSSSTFNASSDGTVTRSNNQSRSCAQSSGRDPSNYALKRFSCQYSHCKDIHSDERTLKAVYISFETSAEFSASLGTSSGLSDANYSTVSNQKRTVEFNMAQSVAFTSSLKESYQRNSLSTLCALLDDGDPYSAMGDIELGIVLRNFGERLEFELEPIPADLENHTQ